jgi:hypothetical protein
MTSLSQISPNDVIRQLALSAPDTKFSHFVITREKLFMWREGLEATPASFAVIL